MKNKTKLLFVPLLTLSLIACGEKPAESDNSGKHTEATSQETTRPDPVEDDKIHIIVLAGQSGARGKALNADLSSEDAEENLDVDIVQDGLTMPQLSKIPTTVTSNITPVKPGFGDSATEFGPEIGMAKTMASRFPKDGATRKSMIVKYSACGSTFTDHWYSKSLVDDDDLSSKLEMNQITEDKNGNPTGPLTNNLYQLVDQSIALIKEEGYQPVIDGVVFCHGEQDAKFEDNMSIYEKALTYFIDDFRSYFDMSTLPFVVTEAGTNAARYSNKLREIQKNVTKNVANTYFVNTEDLYTNTFEPWHFSADSNIVLGERMAEAVISLNDNRKITGFNVEEAYHIPLHGKKNLPSYLEATFKNGTTGIVPVTYPDGMDDTTLGEKTVKVKSTTNWGDFTADIKVIVDENPYVDGDTSDWSGKLNKINDKVSVGFKSTEEGLYIRAEVKDTELWTDGEAWHSGDMGQSGNNDDLRIYLTDSDATNRIPVFLSSDNLLRIYESGSATFNPNKNLVDSKVVTDAIHVVRTTGEVNVPGGGKDCTGMTMECYLPYEQLGISDASALKVAFAYSDISKKDEASKRTETVTFYNTEKANAETSDDSYVALSSLL